MVEEEGAQCPSPAPFTTALSGTRKFESHLPAPPAPGGAEGRGPREVEESSGQQARRCPSVPCPSVQEMLWAHPVSASQRSLSSALSHVAVWFSVSLLSFPSPHSLASSLVLWSLRSSPPPLWVCVGGSPAPVLITALFLIDLSYLGSVVETSLSSAQ